MTDTTTRGLDRRTVLTGSLAAGIGLAAPRARALPTAAKPDKLVYVGDTGPWHYSLVEEAAPAFEKATGIKVEFTLLPYDAWNARLRAELGSGSSGVDIAQWGVQMGGWISPYLMDHQELLAGSASHKADFDWDDFLPASKEAATYDGKLSGIPYRITAGILHYQKALLAEVGYAKPPETFAAFRDAAIKLTAAGAPGRYGMGTIGRQGNGMFVGFVSWLWSMNGRLYDRKTGEVFLNDQTAVDALQFYADLFVKDKVIPPEAVTWEFDEIIAGGQTDRYAMAQMFSPYGTLINDPKVSKTTGRWAWDTVPGFTAKSQSRSWVDGHLFAVPKSCKNKEWAFEFIQWACSKEWLKRSMLRGNAAPRASVLRDPELKASLGWTEAAAAAIETGVPTNGDTIWVTLETQLRTGISQAITGQRTAKQALDAVAADWQRTIRRSAR